MVSPPPVFRPRPYQARAPKSLHRSMPLKRWRRIAQNGALKFCEIPMPDAQFGYLAHDAILLHYDNCEVDDFVD
ncbi:hypothetical protein [Sphingobium sp. BS19]|uniref:hypothetical protein n=1 Tax=Sphingobium sp. BS19 TaxID=3018973 RepID=UPI002491CBEE|nr:hypothetical protein [Sphingobium sp. BS19]